MSSYPNTPWPSEPNQGQWGGPAQPKPPVIPFHPLNLGNLFDGTFAAIRSNPRVMFAISLGVMGIVGMLSGIVSALVPETSIDQVTFGSDTEFAVGVSEFYPAVSDLGLQGIVGLISAGASLLVTGMLVLSVTNAVVGINLDLKSTWEALKPHFWRLVGTAILVWLIVGVVAAVIFIVPIALIAAVAFASSSGDSLWFLCFLLLLIPLGIAVTVWVSVRLYFATLIAVVEGATPPTALRRSWTLTKGAFWRVLGRMLLMSIIVSIVVGLLGGTISAVIMFATSVLPWAVTAFLLALVSALVSGLAMPFSASYTSLMYVDERIRKENLGPAPAQAFDASHGTQA